MSTPPPPSASSVPALAASDIEHAIALIQAAYSPSASSSTSTTSGGTAIQSLQSTLLSIQRTPAAWALVLPLLSHADPNVQFFGAHTAHAKIARGELSTLTPEEQEGLRRELVREAGVQGRTRVVRRKVYGAVVALAVRLVPLGAWGPPGDDTAGQEASQDWIGSTVRALAAAGVRSGDIHEFLAGVAEDVGSANLLPQPRISLDASLRRAAPLVVQSVAAVLQGALDDDLAPALACLAAWLPAKLLPDAELAALVPLLIALLNSQNPLNNDAQMERTQKIGTALSDLLARPPASWGPAVLLEPLLLWAYATFPAFASPDVTVPDYALRLPHGANAQLTTHARLLVALADAGVEWVAGHLVDASAVQHPNPGGGVPRAVLAQTLVRLMLALSAQDPGGARLSASYYASGASPAQGEHADDDADDDDDDGEQQGPGPLGFWYLLQEALWEIPAANTHLFASSSHSPFPSNPSTPLPQEHDMDDDDPERFRRGSPWTPGVVRTGSYAFSGAAANPGTPADEAGAGGRGGGAAEKAEERRTAHARAAYVALVRVLRAKAVCARGWGRDRLERFGVYRRDVGDTIINAYYILRDDLLVYLVDEAAKGGAWETIESPLFLLRAVHEALDLDSTSFSPTALPSSAPALSVGGAALDRLFGDEVWGRLPMATGDPGAGAEAGGGQNGGKGGRKAETRLRRTALGVVDTYAAYFTTRALEALLAPLRYALGALGDADAGVCLQVSFCGVWDLRGRGRGWGKSMKDSLRFIVLSVPIQLQGAEVQAQNGGGETAERQQTLCAWEIIRIVYYREEEDGPTMDSCFTSPSFNKSRQQAKQPIKRSQASRMIRLMSCRRRKSNLIEL
ncbi:hypothetical protein DFH08DRAFT_1085874 [Mycena albidolilacea]|uniref:Importin N-terminal domain-containing protein n=1 Tax=Mycena albidolilacea TaxID=1033008 RepID=A0AAD6ZG91_9AGAR|nr:hypothetical protein DFH08DRAFT_1085874 [Mycena albidolilacea]